MRVRHGFLGLMAFGLVVGQVSAQSIDQTSFIFRRPAPAQCDSCATPASGPVMVVPGETKMDQAPMVDPQAFTQAPAAGGEGGGYFNPAMFGDLIGSGSGFVTIRSSSSGYSSSSSSSSRSGVRVPLVGHGSFKISDNESPRPGDRVFLTYNNFSRASIGDGSTFGLNRELIGFEKSFLDGSASFGMRLPFMEATGIGNNAAGFPSSEVGDLTFIGKYAFINDSETGDVLTGGLALTTPTASHTVTLSDGNALHSYLFQPFAGWIINSGDAFAHGFHALVIPSDHRDITVLNNDVGVGYWVYKNCEGNILRGVVPTLEGHLFTPLDHRNNTDIISASNIFTATGGVNVVLPGNSTFGAALAIPLTGPRPDKVEAILSFNWRF